MCQAQKAQFSASTAERGKDHARHLGTDCAAIGVPRRQGNDKHAACREDHKDDDADMVWDRMDEIWGAELGEERGDDISEKDDAFRNIWSDEVEGGRENYHVEDVVDQS